jgi:Family of unknown function (DUF6221)
MTSDLVTFLNARLDEDEAAARAVEDNSAPWPGQWEADGNYALRTHNGWVLATAGTPGGEFRPGVLAHIVRHDPARVLREVEAKRARLAYYQDAQAKLDRIIAHPGEMSSGDEGMWLGKTAASRMTCRHDAAIWSDHPGYRPEWKP